MNVPILVVDDDAVFLEAVRESLALVAPEFTMYAASSGREALAVLREGTTAMQRPAFIVLDYHLGDCEAPNVLREIRAVDRLREIPVMVLTQFVWERDCQAATDAGAAQFRVKPSRVRELVQLLLKFWEEHVHEREPAVARG
jgi:chemosensory pili system protein ChpA (sensor histidine kinase/response regulator)